MATTTIYVPQDKIKSFEKLAKKCQKYFSLSYNIGEAILKRFAHIDMDGTVRWQFHSVYPCEVSQFVSNDWELIAVVKDGALLIVKTSEELHLSNGHGKDCYICEECGHRMKNSYILRNVHTNEEKQIGGECVKKFGISCKPQNFQAIISELSSYFSFTKTERWDFDYSDTNAIDSQYIDDIIVCAKAYYNTNKVWKKGYYDNDGFYHKSPSAEDLKDIVLSDVREIIPKGYIQKVKAYITQELAAKTDLTDFELDMLRMSRDTYCTVHDTVFAFFMIKKYENSLLECNVKVGDYIEFQAELIDTTIQDGYYGSYEKNTLKTEKGTILVRNGKVNATNKKVTGFALVKAINLNKEIILDRVTKTPKKGVTIIKIN